MNVRAKSYYVAIIFFASIILSSCSSVSVFSPEAYQQAVNLKVESLDLMSFATLPYSEFEEEVAFLNTEPDKAYEYAKGRPSDEISTKHWEILINQCDCG